MALTAPAPFVFDNSIVVPSTVTSISSAFAVIPSPPITFKVADPELAPPSRPVPATTSVMSPVAPDPVPSPLSSIVNVLPEAAVTVSVLVAEESLLFEP